MRITSGNFRRASENRRRDSQMHLKNSDSIPKQVWNLCHTKAYCRRDCEADALRKIIRDLFNFIDIASAVLYQSLEITSRSPTFHFFRFLFFAWSLLLISSWARGPNPELLLNLAISYFSFCCFFVFRAVVAFNLFLGSRSESRMV